MNTDASTEPYIEIETKLFLVGPTASMVRSHLDCLFRCVEGRHHEMNVNFDTPDERLKREDKTLRLRRKNLGYKVQYVLTFKSPSPDSTLSDFRHSVETEFDIPSFQMGLLLLTGLGFSQVFTYEKYRTTYQDTNTKTMYMLDETPIGTFVEIEGQPEHIRDAITQLMLDDMPRTKKGYRRLYRDICKRLRYGDEIKASFLFEMTSQYTFPIASIIGEM